MNQQQQSSLLSSLMGDGVPVVLEWDIPTTAFAALAFGVAIAFGVALANRLT